MIFPKPQRCRAIVEFSRCVNHKAYVVRLRMERPSSILFIPGQYCSFILGDTVRRNFSFTTPPSLPSAFEICADVTPMGPGSRWILAVKPGDTVEFLGPLGRFVVDDESPRRKVFVATGTGIAPIRGMILDAFEKNPSGEVSLYWGLRFERDLFWQEDFQNIVKKHPSFYYVLTLSRPEGEWLGNVGRVTKHLVHDARDADYYLCGNKEMIYEVRDHLLREKILESQIKSELFY